MIDAVREPYTLQILRELVKLRSTCKVILMSGVNLLKSAADKQVILAKLVKGDIPSPECGL